MSQFLKLILIDIDDNEEVNIYETRNNNTSIITMMRLIEQCTHHSPLIGVQPDMADCYFFVFVFNKLNIISSLMMSF